MPAECRPPPNTAPGTVCVLRNEYGELDVTWTGVSWRRPGMLVHVSAQCLADCGWRFVRVAEAPDV